MADGGEEHYLVHQQVLSRIQEAAFNENDNVLVVLNRQQGRTTILLNFLKWLDESEKEINVGVVSSSFSRAKETVRQFNQSRNHCLVVHPMSPHHLDGEKHDLVLIDEAYFIFPDKLIEITEKYHYIAMTSPKDSPPELNNNPTVLDRRWFCDGKVIDERVPPWLNLEEFERMLEIFRRHNFNGDF